MPVSRLSCASQVIFTGPDGSPQECKVADLTLAEFKALVTEEEAMEDSESCNG